MSTLKTISKRTSQLNGNLPTTKSLFGQRDTSKRTTDLKAKLLAITRLLEQKTASPRASNPKGKSAAMTMKPTPGMSNAQETRQTIIQTTEEQIKDSQRRIRKTNNEKINLQDRPQIKDVLSEQKSHTHKNSNNILKSEKNLNGQNNKK